MSSVAPAVRADSPPPGDGRSEAERAFEREVVALFTETAALLGIAKSVAAIYAVVFASPTPLSFAEIEARLQISKGSVSQGLRSLREIGAILEVSAPEDRLERFAPDLEMRKLLERFLRTRILAQLDASQRRLMALATGMAALPKDHVSVLKPRLRKLQRWQQRTGQLLPVVTTLLRVKYAAKPTHLVRASATHLPRKA